MPDMEHIPLPRDTPAIVCGDCGAVALSANDVCKAQGRIKKADWCGTPSAKPPKFCQKKIHNNRWQCRKCGQIAVNPELLCEPVVLNPTD